MKRSECTLDFIAKAQIAHGTQYDYSKVSLTKKTDWALIGCTKHGDFRQRAFSHQQGYGCPSCGAELASKKLTSKPNWRKETPEKWLSKIKKKHPNYDLSRAKFKDLQTPIQIRCKKHDLWFEQKPFNAVYTKSSGRGCPECNKDARGKAVALTLTEYQDRVSDRFPGVQVLKYSGMHESVLCKCPKHGTFKAECAQVLTVDGRGCPTCNPQGVSYLELLLISHFPEASHRDKSLGLELDLFWPNQRLGVELNGSYYHSTKFKDPDYHLNKTLRCRDAKVQLLHFWGNEVLDKTDLVVWMIKSRLGQASIRVGARKCQVVSIPDKGRNRANVHQFFQDNHLQGSVGYDIATGLFLDNALVGCATFGKPRWTKDYEWELLRLAFKKGWSIAGGASRLLAEFERTFKPKTLVSYANLRFSYGDVYRRLGFQFVRRSSPNYWWWLPGKGLQSRYQTQKHKLSQLLSKYDPAKSESENMTRSGAYQLFDCGNLVYAKHYS